MVKRALDLAVSVTGLCVLWPALLVIGLLVKLGDGGPVFYRGVRAGLDGTRFRIFKFRTMAVNAEKLGGASTADDDPRTTKVGKSLRKYKLDELPQLINVLKGEMSFVGPRPEVQQYVDLYTEEEKAILTVRPGITDLATLWNPDEGAALAGSPDPERTYLEKIRPEKIRLQLEYVRNRSFLVDLSIIAQTLWRLIVRRRPGALSSLEVKGYQTMQRMRDPVPADFLLSLYRTMLRIRLFEERAAELMEQGEIKTPCHLYIGQEANAAGVCAALEQKDYIWGGHRSHGHYLAKGGNLRAMMAELFGKATGCSKGRGGSMHLVAPEVGLLGTVPLVAATIPLAVGAGLASKLRGDGRVSVSFFGDGATEEGHFHEAVNLAAVYRLPVVFVCENNLYASHMSLLECRAEDNIYKAGIVHGIPGVSLDGNDVVAVYQATTDAVARARSGRGPTLLECRTYRWRGHVGPSWDMDVGVKRKEDLKEWVHKDPVARTKATLLKLEVPLERLDELEQAIRTEVEEAVTFACESPYPDEGELLKYVYCSDKGAR